MQHETIDMREPTPDPKAPFCRFFVWSLYLFLKGFNLLLALFIWYRFDYFYAIVGFLVGYVVMGIVRSKIRNSVIPPKQQELSYSDMEIAKWFVQRELCLEPQ